MPTPIDLGIVRDTITEAKYNGSGTAGIAGNDDEYTLISTLNPNGVGSFIIHNGENGVGVPAGFGNVTTSVTTVQRPSGTNAGVNSAVNTSGPNEAKNMQFVFEFNIPKGSDGVLTSSGGAIGLEVDPQTGQLFCYSADSTSNGMYLVSDDPNSPYYYATLGLDASYVGHLVNIYGGNSNA